MSASTEAMQVLLRGSSLVDANGEVLGTLPDEYGQPGAFQQLAEAMQQAELLHLDAASIMDDHRATVEVEYLRLVDGDERLQAIQDRLQDLQQRVVGPFQDLMARWFMGRDQRVELGLGPVEVVWSKPRRTVSAGRPISELIAPRGRADLAQVLALALTRDPATPPEELAGVVIDWWLRPQTSTAAPATPTLRLTAQGLDLDAPTS